MSTMISEVYDALKEAGASEEKARKAAETLSGYETRFSSIENDIATFRAETRGEFNLVKWMLGTNFAFVLAIFWRVFTQ